MMLLIGLFIIPFSILLIGKARDYKTTKKELILINLGIISISVLFIVVTFMVNKEPFTFEIETGSDYALYSLLIFLFTPFLWIHFGYYIKSLTKRFRIKKKAKAKSKNEFTYYRDDLNKLSPGLLMYVRCLEVDTKKAIAASILKLKLTKNIEETKTGFKVNKTNNLLKSEQMIIDLIDKGNFNDKAYVKELNKEALDEGFVKKNSLNIFFRIIKIILIILIPVINTILSIKFDSYVYDNYKTYIKDHKRYVLVEDEIGDVHFGHPGNIEDYYHGYVNELGEEFYDKSLLSVNKLDNEMVRKTVIFQTIDGIYFVAAFILDITFVILFIEELQFINKNYKRTKKGVDIINKSYALKNFLNDFSTIKDKNEKELILWEYYLVYSVALGLNVQINDKLINKYVK